MNGYEFWSSVIHSLAWPIIVLVVSVVLRQGITDFLGGLRHLHLSGFGVNAEADRDIAHIEGAAEVVRAISEGTPPPPAEAPENTDTSAAVEVRPPQAEVRSQGVGQVIFDYGSMQAMASINPRSTVLEAGETIERRIRSLFEGHVRSRSIALKIASPTDQIYGLAQAGIIPNYLTPVLRAIIDVRDRARREAYDLTTDEALRYARQALDAYGELNRADAIARSRVYPKRENASQ